MREVRRRFHEELHALEGDVQRTGTQAQRLLEQALQALAHSDPAICDEVIRGDDEVDQLYLDVERRILGLFALQTPVASELRLLTALLHINLHLERMQGRSLDGRANARYSTQCCEQIHIAWRGDSPRPTAPNVQSNRPPQRASEPSFITATIRKGKDRSMHLLSKAPFGRPEQPL